MSKTNKGRLSDAEMGTFFENMGMMVKAGITVSEAVDLLKEETDPADTRMCAALAGMADGLSAGDTFERAVQQSGVFPDYAIDMVGAAETTGRLEDTLFHLSDYYRSEHSLKKTLASAVRYPLILFGLIIALLIVMLTLVFPAFYGVYNNLGGSISSSSFRYIDVSFTICRVMLWVMVALVVILLICIILWKCGKTSAVRGLLMKFPTFRRLLDSLDLYRFTSCFSMFLSSGALQEEAMKDSIKVVEGEALKAKLERALAKMEAGESFSQVAYAEKIYDSLNNRMLIPAERSGMLESVLEKLLKNLKGSNEQQISHIANTLEPLLTGVMMVFIGLMLISLMIPLIGIMNAIG